MKVQLYQPLVGSFKRTSRSTEELQFWEEGDRSSNSQIDELLAQPNILMSRRGRSRQIFSTFSTH